MVTCFGHHLLIPLTNPLDQDCEIF